MKPKPPWEDESGVLVLRLYKSDKYGPWLKDVNKAHLHPDWPRVVLLDLTAEQFKEFDKDPFAFTNKHDLYFEQPVVWSSPCAKPPLGKDIPLAREESRWTVAILHTHDSEIVCAACPQSTEKRKYK